MNYTVSLTTANAESTTSKGYNALADALHYFEDMEMPAGSIAVVRDERSGTVLASYREEMDHVSIAR